ncbi:MAG: GNAT family N-acetyltransferase [Flavobacteriales bacterium]
MMTIREARPADIPAMHAIRLRVRENRLSDPSVVKEQDYHDFMARDTGNWIGEVDGAIAGFAMVDVEKRNLWALFVAPEHEFNGLGRALHEAMLTWYFGRADTLRLSTDPATRAFTFYHQAGYSNMGPTANGREVILELRRKS